MKREIKSLAKQYKQIKKSEEKKQVIFEEEKYKKLRNLREKQKNLLLDLADKTKLINRLKKYNNCPMISLEGLNLVIQHDKGE